MAAASSTDIWAVGRGYSADELPIIEHWDGVAWTASTPPTPSPLSVLSSIFAVSSADIWAVGVWNDNNTERPLIEHSRGPCS